MDAAGSGVRPTGGLGHLGVPQLRPLAELEVRPRLGAARERIRVARSLGELPEITASFAAGQLSYSKVWAPTRVATPETEAALLEMAKQGTASHLERIVRAYRKAQRDDELDEVNRSHEARSLHRHHDDEGSFVLHARLTPDRERRWERPSNELWKQRMTFPRKRPGSDAPPLAAAPTPRCSPPTPRGAVSWRRAPPSPPRPPGA